MKFSIFDSGFSIAARALPSVCRTQKSKIENPKSKL